MYSVEQSYDMNNNVSKIVQSAGTISPYQKYSYGKDNLPDVYTMFSNRTQTYTFDSLNRYSKMELSLDKPVTINYVYHLSERNKDSSEKYRTTKLKCEFINNTAYRYNYDKLGNIIQVEQGTRVEGTNSGTNYSANLKYEYDALSQLTRENNKYLNQTITYTYDKGGNITKKTIYPYTAGSLNGVAPTETIVYNYGNSSWTDLLTSYNGQNITYDAIGNPTSYLGYTLKWNGRQLSSLSGNGTTASYKYDADGLRSYKKVNGVETTYQYVGDKLMYEKRGATEFYYYYNSFGNLAGIKYVQNGTEYMVYAICNMRGDVEDLYWGSGNLACHYTYDTWGNVISVTDINGKEITNANHIGLMNPIRYRGYYYDSEIGMYYLQSRYYNPQVGRFISADGQLNNDLLGNNLFAYCGNNPVTRLDDNGQGWWIVAGAAVGGIISAATKAVSNIMSGTKWYNGVAGAFVGGAVSGAITAATCNTTAAAFAGAAAESATNQLLSYIPKVCKAVGQDKPTKVNKRNVLVSVGTVAAETAVYGLVSKGAGKIAQQVIPINSGWFKPQKFSSCFSGNYAHKFQGQTLMQSSMVAGADSIKQMVEKVVDIVMGQEPTFELYPEVLL